MDCILQWAECFGSSLAGGIILGTGLALLTESGSGSAKKSPGEPDGHITDLNWNLHLSTSSTDGLASLASSDSKKMSRALQMSRG